MRASATFAVILTLAAGGVGAQPVPAEAQAATSSAAATAATPPRADSDATAPAGAAATTPDPAGGTNATAGDAAPAVADPALPPTPSEEAATDAPPSTPPATGAPAEAAAPAAPAEAAPEGTEAAAVAEPTVAAATVVPAAISEVRAQVPISGTLVPRQEVQISPQVSGLEIREILVEAGDRVSAGQVLARLAAETVRAQLAQAEAEFQRAVAGVGQARSQIVSANAALTQAATALDRTQRLQRLGNTAQAALDQAVAAEASARAQASAAKDGLAVAQAALAQAAAARDIARLNLGWTEIKAPVSGLITARGAELGAIAAAGATPLFTLVAGGEIELAAEVIETALPVLKPGAPADITVAGFGTVEGEVRLVPARVDPTTRLGLVRISLEAADALRPGLFASGWITTDRHDGVTVPATAILSEGGAERVQVVRDGRVESREVRAGLIWEGRREILEGLAAGEVVIARAGAFFRDGDPVNAVPAEEAAEPAPAAIPLAEGKRP